MLRNEPMVKLIESEEVPLDTGISYGGEVDECGHHLAVLATGGKDAISHATNVLGFGADLHGL